MVTIVEIEVEVTENAPTNVEVGEEIKDLLGDLEVTTPSSASRSDDLS